MQYIEFGKDKDKVSEIVMGLMRISEMSTGEVLDLIETGLEEGINFWISQTFMVAENQKK